jgi:hypothetical protein
MAGQAYAIRPDTLSSLQIIVERMRYALTYCHRCGSPRKGVSHTPPTPPVYRIERADHLIEIAVRSTMNDHFSLSRPDQLANNILRKEQRIAELTAEIKQVLAR